MNEAINLISVPTDDRCVATLFKDIPDKTHVMSRAKGETIFSQGDRADSVYFIQSGSVKMSVVSCTGKEGVLAIMGPGSFFGEESLSDQSVRMGTATALEPSTVLQVEKSAMMSALHAQTHLADVFIAFLLNRCVNLEEDLADQLFNHSEKRLARVLLKLARMGEHGAEPDVTLPKLSHETLAEMVGTTRSRITHFMNKFRKMHLIEYNGHACDHGFGLIVRTGRLTDVVLEDQERPRASLFLR